MVTTKMQIPDLTDPALAQRLQHKLDHKTKPLGSLGRLEALALQIGLVLGTEMPVLEQPQLVVFAGDHGLAARGVSAYPSDVTWQMVENFLAGGAAVSVLARQHGLALTVVDCGVARDVAPRERLLVRKIAPGTADSSTGPAMSAAQCEQAIANGRAIVQALPGNALLLGEMGIGNTSAASLLLARLTGHELSECVGAGTGLDKAGIERKRKVLREVLAFHAQAVAPLEALAAFGGFEIATMAGAVLEAAAQRRVIVVDGFISSAAVLVAQRLAPAVTQRCVFSHRSGECGHALMLRHLGPTAQEPARALLDLGLRLGEGSGAALAWPLLVSACALLREMASFESAGVSGPA
ncbi:MAG: putative Nicotinate-nucleotide--dimethylbenzimidazole phosphoribosyltransferase [Ramlibacter sp.]|nr:putative Nicotinate-nucleotide--dimethylbenzimidazole phosphoribosyltransferase [Ramlibacter sp.]